MAVWLELRCEARNNAGVAGCWSHSNSGPSDLAGDTHADVLDTLRNIEGHAKAAGWKKIRGVGWVCPVCDKQGHLAASEAP